MSERVSLFSGGIHLTLPHFCFTFTKAHGLRMRRRFIIIYSFNSSIAASLLGLELELE